MDAARFLQDLAVVLGVAAASLLLFRRLGWPPVLGYLAAGLVVGPHTPPYALVQLHSIEAFAEVGVVFLMFALGAEFNLRRLARLGLKPLFCALVEAAVMLAAGLGLGRALGWGAADGLVLGAALGLASTAIVARTLLERAGRPQGWEELAAGVLIAEDLLAVLFLALVASFGPGGDSGDAAYVLLRFVGLAAAVGAAAALLLPRLLAAAESSGVAEAHALAAVGVCFGLATATRLMGFSPALGAFIAGAAATLGGRAVRLQEIAAPFRDVFGAVFFVSVGMLIDPVWLRDNLGLATGAAVAATAARFLANTGAFAAAGVRPAPALAASAARLPIGEFSFLLALGAARSGLTAAPVHSVVVAVCVVSTVAASVSLPRMGRAASALPRAVSRAWEAWASRVERTAGPRPGAVVWPLLRPSLVQMVVNAAVCVGLHHAAAMVPALREADRARPGVLWLAATAASLPFLSALARKAQAVALILLEASSADPVPFLVRHPSAARVAPALASLASFGGYWFATRASLPEGPRGWAVMAVAAGAGAVLRRPMVRAHAWAQASLRDLFGRDEAEEPERALGAFARSLEPARLRLLKLALAPGDWGVGHSLAELELRSRTGASVLQLSRGGRLIPSPGGDARLLPCDELVLIAEPEQLELASALLKRGPET